MTAITACDGADEASGGANRGRPSASAADAVLRRSPQTGHATEPEAAALGMRKRQAGQQDWVMATLSFERLGRTHYRAAAAHGPAGAELYQHGRLVAYG